MKRKGLVGALIAFVLASGLGASGAPSESDRIDLREASKAAGLDGLNARTWGTAWADVDRDGWPELLVGRHWRSPQYFVNHNGSFSKVAVGALRKGPLDRHACAWGEANGDGRPDLYCTRGAQRGSGRGPNQLLIQRAGGWQDRAARKSVRDAKGRGRTLNWLDYDLDGDLDLFVGNAARADAGNVLFRNDGSRFSRADVGVSEILNTVGSSWADWDLDGDPDLLVLQHRPDPAIAYENVGGRFRRVDIPFLSDTSWLSAAWGDFDADGRPDVHLVGVKRAVVLKNGGDGFEVIDDRPLVQGRMSVWFDPDNDGDQDLFVVQGAKGDSREDSDDHLNRPDLMLVNTGFGFERLRGDSFRGPRGGDGDAVAAADYDRDGGVDLIVTNGYFHSRGRTLLLRNRSQGRGNWVGVELDGGDRNPFGFGAVVEVHLDGRVLSRSLTDGFTFRSQSEPGYMHWGLGTVERTTVRVRWPDGSSDCQLVLANQVIRITHGTRPCLDLP